MSNITRVLIADDHPALRIGLRMLLEQAPDMKVIGEVANGNEALAQIEALRPDVAVLDCRLPGMTGAEVAAEARQRGLPVRVLALSAYSDDPDVQEMLKGGAAGYLLKEEAPGVILSAVRAVARGDSWFSPTVVARMIAWARGERPGGLTERELEVLQFVAQGLTNKEIAQELKVRERTVGFHVSNILSKLDVASRVEAAVWAKDHGVIG